MRNLHSIKTEDLKKELNRREAIPGVWKVVKYLRNDAEGWYDAPKFIHLIEDSNGVRIEAQLVHNIYDKNLNDKQPTCSDEDPNWDSDWEDYGEFCVEYFIGKKVEIESFDPFKISRIILE